MAHIYDVNGKKIYLGGEIQYPEAYQLPIGSNPDNIGSLKPKIVKAHADKAADRPDSAHFEFYCIGCHSRMHWVKGAQRERQGNPSTPQPNYGRSFFQHNPYTLKNHLTMEAPLLVADLGTIVENISYVNNLTYEAVATLSASARIIALTANLAYGKKIELNFLSLPIRLLKYLMTSMALSLPLLEEWLKITRGLYLRVLTALHLLVADSIIYSKLRKIR